jgi:hypothetical protein
MRGRLPGFRWIVALAATAGTLVLITPGASAPPLITIIDDPTPGYQQRFGESLSSGDVNNDGRDDIAATSDREVHVFDSGGGLLYTLDLGATELLLATRMVDVNEDGRDDVLLGSSDARKAWAFSGADGSLILEIANPAGDAPSSRFGGSIAGGDLNGDGRAELVVGDPRLMVNGRAGQGRAYAFSGADGSLMHTFDSPNPDAPQYSSPAVFGAHFGQRVVAGDVDGDNIDDVMITAHFEDIPLAEVSAEPAPDHFISAVPHGPSSGATAGAAAAMSPCVDLPPSYVCLAGRAYLFSGLSGQLIRSVQDVFPQESRALGDFATLADIDGDGTNEAILSGVDGFTGAYSTQTGALLRTFAAPSVSASGDADGDGKDDIVGGDVNFEIVAYGTGRAIVDFAAGYPLPLTSPNLQSNAFFGVSIFADTNGDGRDEVIVSADREDTIERDEGRIYVMCACDVDVDGDHYSSSLELHLGTESALACHDDQYLADWPPDFDYNRQVDMRDVRIIKRVFGSTAWPEVRRFDLAPSESITIADVLAMKSAFGQSCTP